MPQRIFRDTKKETGFMKAFFLVICLILACGGSFTLGWYTSNKGYRVVDSDGGAIVKSNAAQIVKDENAKLGRDVIGKSESDAEELLKKNNRTIFIGARDGKVLEYKGQKTFTNLTVEVKDGKVLKVIGWY